MKFFDIIVENSQTMQSDLDKEYINEEELVQDDVTEINDDPTGDPLNQDTEVVPDINLKLDSWLSQQGITNIESSDILKGIDVGSFSSLVDALDSDNDKEIISVLKDIKHRSEQKSAFGQAEDELEESFGDFGNFGTPSSTQTTKPQKATPAQKMQSAKDMQNKLKANPNVSVAINTPDNTSIEVDLEDVAIDTQNPENTMVAVKSKTNPNEIEMVPLDMVSMMEGFSRVIDKQVLNEYKTVQGIHGSTIQISNEENEIMSRIKNLSFLEEDDLADRELKLCRDLNKKGIIKRVKYNDIIGYKSRGKL